jgi:hypothetical protein
MISRCDLLCNLSPRAWSCRFVVLTARCLAKTPTAALIARVGCGRSLLYAWVSLSHASLLVVGIRACKVIGETRFAGSVFTRQSRRRSIKCALFPHLRDLRRCRLPLLTRVCGHTVGVRQDLLIISSNAFFPAWLASSHERNWSVDSSTGSVLPSEKISQVYRFGAAHRCFTSTRRWLATDDRFIRWNSIKSTTA